MYLVATLCLLGLATAQNITDLTSCITKENNLKMECTFKPADPKPTCKFMQGNKIVATNYPSESQDATYKNRANITIMGDVCELSLTGLPDNVQEFKCLIKQTKEVQKAATVEKKTAAKCSALSVLLQKGTGMFLVLMTLPLLSELI